MPAHIINQKDHGQKANFILKMAFSTSRKDLKDMGFENIAEMEGGFGAWKKRGAIEE